MQLTQKETSLLKDLKTQEKLCAEKYEKYSAEALDPQLKTCFRALRIPNGTTLACSNNRGRLSPRDCRRKPHTARIFRRYSVADTDAKSTTAIFAPMFSQWKACFAPL